MVKVKPWLLGPLMVLALLRVAAAENFSQHSGFQAWREAVRANPVGARVHEQALLEKHRPVFLLPPRHPGLVDFYRDYVANAELRTGAGDVVSGPLTQSTLNSHAADPGAELVHRPPETLSSIPAVVYARADPVRVDAGDGVHRLLVLTWHAVFRHSGLPAGLNGALEAAGVLAGGVDDWHQLDHYTAVSLILDSARRPVALMLQQHNYTRTHLIGESIELPPDGRPRVDVALRSNELFPAQPGRRWRRAVRFADAGGLRYLMGFGDEPLMAARDLTDGEREAHYRLEFLRQDDAFYLFEGYLGERRLLPGRDGPPGAGYNTLPELKPLAIALFTGYWREASREDLQRFERSLESGRGRRDFALAQREVFFENLACLRRLAQVCR